MTSPSTLFVSLGSNCYVSWTLRKCGLQSESYPFDWINTFHFGKELEFIKDLKNSPLILNNMPFSPLKPDQENIKSIKKSYYLEKYCVRFPHEHDVKSDTSFQDIMEKYSRRYQRLENTCKTAKHIIFIRVIAHSCYELANENANNYSDELINEAINTLKNICQHDRFTLLLVSLKEKIICKENANVVSTNLKVPFENIFFKHTPNMPLQDEAKALFDTSLAALSKAENTAQVKQFLTYPFEI